MSGMLMATRTGLPATFDIEQFLINSAAKLKTWGGLLLILIGVVMMISHGKKQVSWAVCIIMLILGGALCSFGMGDDAWNWVQGIAKGGKETIDDLGGAGGGGGGTTPTIINWLFQ